MNCSCHSWNRTYLYTYSLRRCGTYCARIYIFVLMKKLWPSNKVCCLPGPGVTKATGNNKSTNATQKWSRTVKWPTVRPAIVVVVVHIVVVVIIFFFFVIYVVVVVVVPLVWSLKVGCWLVTSSTVESWLHCVLPVYAANSYCCCCCCFCFSDPCLSLFVVAIIFCLELAIAIAIAFLALVRVPHLKLPLLLLLLLLFLIRSSFNSVFIYTCPACMCMWVCEYRLPTGRILYHTILFRFYYMSLRRGRHSVSLCGYLYLCVLCEYAIVSVRVMVSLILPCQCVCLCGFLKERVKCVLWFYMNFLEFFMHSTWKFVRQEFHHNNKNNKNNKKSSNSSRKQPEPQNFCLPRAAAAVPRVLIWIFVPERSGEPESKRTIYTIYA